MSSPRKQAANRRNARKSTGPRTPEGKRSSSRNALKHGLASRNPVHLPPSIEQQLPDRIAMWELTVGPVVSGRRWILRKMAVASLQADACEQQQSSRLFFLQVDALEKLTRPTDTPEAAPAPADFPDAPPTEFPLIDITPTGLTLNRYHHEALRMVLRLMRRLEQSALEPGESGRSMEEECRRDFERAYNSLPVPTEPARTPAPSVGAPSVLCELDPAPLPHPECAPSTTPGRAPAVQPDPARYASRYRALLFEALEHGTPRSDIDHEALLARARREVDGPTGPPVPAIARPAPASKPSPPRTMLLPVSPPPTRRKPGTGRRVLDALGASPAPTTLPFSAGRHPSTPSPARPDLKPLTGPCESEPDPGPPEGSTEV